MNKVCQYRVIKNNNKHAVLVMEREVDAVSVIHNSPEKIVEIVNTMFFAKDLAEEYVFLLAMDAKCHITGVFELSHGTASYSLCQPREIFVRLLLCNATSYVIVHNHPSGDCQPSSDDHKLTRRLREASELMGISMLDHIIVGDGYFSFKENGC